MKRTLNVFKKQIMVCLMVMITHCSQSQTSKFLQLSDSLYKARAYEASLQSYSQAIDSARFPTLKKIAYYNMACALAQLNQKQKSLACLDTAINFWGYANYKQLKEDKDLMALHQEPKWKQLVKGLKKEYQKREHPRYAKLVTDDVHHFWQAYDLAQKDSANSVAIYQSYYFDKATPGLQDYTLMRIGSVQNFVNNQKAKTRYYKTIRTNTLAVDLMKEGIYKSFEHLKKVYAKAVFPDIYFVIGRLNSGGTVSDNGLLIGLDQNAKDSLTEIQELNLWEKNNTHYINNLPGIVAHELIHFQQKLAPDTTLLAKALGEGMCDFLGELICGKNINSRLQSFAHGKRLAIWLDFKNDMDKRTSNKWLYGGRDVETPERPSDLGYYMGYEISKAYYEQARDKKQAIFDMLHIKDYRAFLAKSRYEEKVQGQEQ